MTRQIIKEVAARGSALAIGRAVDHLEAALKELNVAHAEAATTGARLDATAELALHSRLSTALRDVDPATGERHALLPRIRRLRDRRAGVAGFSFE